jgi:hypothetical protein
MKLLMPGLLLPLLMLAGCTGQRAADADTIPPPGDAVVGVVRVVGSAPVNVHVMVQPEGGRPVRVAGPLRAEIQRLAGARVAVRGRLEPSPDPMAETQVEATDYEILSVDGEPVIFGTVESRADGWTILRTRGGELVYLAGAAEALRPGQKVWVQGPSARIVQSYGVVTP